MKVRTLFVLFILTLNTGCASYVAVTPDAGEPISYASGRAVITSAESTSTVLLSHKGVVRKGNRLGFYVTIRNESDETYEVDTRNVAVYVNDSKQLKVYTHEAIAKEIRREAMWSAIAAGLSAAGSSMSAMNAGYSTTTTHGTYAGSGTYNSYNGSSGGSMTSYGSYSGTSTTYDPAAVAALQMQANAESEMRMAEIMNKKASGMAQASRMLRRTTLKPGHSYEALLVVDAPKRVPSDVQLIFKLGNDFHYIDFDYTKSKN